MYEAQLEGRYDENSSSPNTAIARYREIRGHIEKFRKETGARGVVMATIVDNEIRIVSGRLQAAGDVHATFQARQDDGDAERAVRLAAAISSLTAEADADRARRLRLASAVAWRPSGRA